jgi:hypothetical protein
MKRALLAAASAFALIAPSAHAVDVSWSAFGTSVVPGWYVSDVWINWSLTNVSPPLQQGCNPVHLVTDTTGTTATCTATDASGTTTKTTTTIRIDRTPPSAAATADRVPDVAGIYNQPLTVGWSGVDATSGIASCTSLPYGGPDGTAIAVSGTCRDRAGNVSAPASFVFNYDSTPPDLGQVRANAEDRSVILSWQASGAARVLVTRTAGGARAAQNGIVYDGTGASYTDTGLSNGTKYTYTVQAIDAANNVATDSITVTPSAAASSVPLLSPRSRAELRRPPLLRWRPIKAASYYNVQLYRHGKKILSAWPKRAHYQLRSKWHYRGRTHRLSKGTYVWYVWGGYGHRSQHRYGKLLGKRAFKIT